jgi:hypothetical protein
LILKCSTLILWFCLLLCNLFSDSVYPFREISKPPVSCSEIEKFVVISPMRCGSTLCFMTLQYLFEDVIDKSFLYDFKPIGKNKVFKTHDINICEKLFDTEKTFFLIPVRHPISATESLIKLNLNGAIIPNLGIYSSITKFIEQKKPKNYLVINYENFVLDRDYLINILKKELNFNISYDDSEKINKLFSKESMMDYQKRFPEFSEYDPTILLHGKHISQEDRKLYELLEKSDYKKFIEIISAFLPLFDYEHIPQDYLDNL